MILFLRKNSQFKRIEKDSFKKTLNEFDAKFGEEL